MRKMASWLLAAALGVSVPAFAQNEEQEEEHAHETMKLSELPTGAQDALRREAGSGKIEEVRREWDKNGNFVYEAEIVTGGKGRDITVSADGQILKRGNSHDEAKESHE